jgi:uncharacterized protein involved in outer membrane biogenesis
MDPRPAAPTRLPRLRLLAIVLFAPVALALALLVSAPLWIDAPKVRARMVGLVDGLSGGRARWDSLELHYLPRPRVTLRQVSFELPPTAAVEARAIALELELLPLLRGEVRSGRAVLTSPRVRVQLPPADPASPPPTVAGLRAAVRNALDTLFEKLPSARVELDDGELELLTDSGTAFRFTAVALQGSIADGRLEASASASSRLFDRLAVEVAMRQADFQGSGHATLSGLHLGALAALLPSTAVEPDPADATAELSWRIEGIDDLSADLEVAAPELSGSHGAGRLELAGLVVEARARLRGDTFELELPRAALARPLLESRGRLAFAPGTGWHAALELVRADLGQLQSAAARFLPEVAMLATPPARIAEGSMAGLTLEAAGPALADLATLAALRADARVEGATVLIAAAALEARGVGAHASLGGGALRVDGLAGRTDAGELTGGTFNLKLDARPVTLEGSATARLDLAGVAALAARLLDPSGSARREPLRLHELQGSARVRVDLAGEAQRPRPRVVLSPLSATGRHELLPLPLAVTAGSVTFGDATLALRGLSGSIGRSTLRGTDAQLRFGAAPSLESASDSADIDLEEVLRVARAHPELAGPLEGVRAVNGRLAVRLESATGPLADPGAIGYTMSATPREVTLEVPALGPTLALDDGTVALTAATATAQAVGAALLDGTLRASGRVPLQRRRGAVPRVTASGMLGPQILEWIHARAGLPEVARLRDPVTLHDVSLDRPGNDDFTTRGEVRVAGGPALTFDLRRAGRRMELRSLAVRDAHSDGNLGASLEGSRFAVHLAGHLAGRSMADPLRRPELAAALLRGDVRVSGDWTDPGHGKADGFLEATRIPVPAGTPRPLLIERARVDADGSKLRIAEAIIMAGPSRLSLEGSIDRAARKFRVDATIRGDALDLPAREEPSAPAAPTPGGDDGGPARKGSTDTWERLFAALNEVPVAGRVSVDLGRLRAGKLEVSLLRARAVLEDGRLQVDIGSAALCGVSLSGSFSARRGDVGGTGTLNARGAALENTLPCLTDGRLRFIGRLDLDGGFSARGAPGALAQNFTASFRAISRDGRIDEFDALTRLLRLVNLTEVARGAIDVGSAGTAYRSASVTGTVKGRIVHLDEGILDAEGIKIVAEGTIDYRDGALAANVLAAPMQTANWLVDKIPLVRRILGGTVLAIPARAGGAVKDPVVVPLGARAVRSRMVDLLANTVRLPADLVKTLEPAGSKAGKPVEDSGKPVQVLRETDR